MLQREDDEEDIRFPNEKDKSVSITDIPRDIDTSDSDSSADEVEIIKTNIVNPEIISEREPKTLPITLVYPKNMLNRTH